MVKIRTVSTEESTKNSENLNWVDNQYNKLNSLFGTFLISKA